MALHPIFEQVLDSHAGVTKTFTRQPETHRGWVIEWDYGYFTATGPDYDASWEGEEDGWVDNGHRVSSRTRDGVIAEIDNWFDEQALLAARETGGAR